jgi:hypothetical protein
MALRKTRTISDVQFPLPPQGASDEELAFYRSLKNYIDRGFQNLQLPDYQKGVKQLLAADVGGLKWLPAAGAITNTKFYPIAVWWQKIEYIDYWIKERGVNIFMWDDRISSTAGDIVTMHNTIETYRQQGYDVSVIRHPGSYWYPDPQTADFDRGWYNKGHIHAFSYPDEWEDKIPGGGGGDVTFNPPVLYAAFAGRMSDYDSWVTSMGLTPGTIKYFINFNGTHINGTTISIYLNMISAGSRPMDIVCSDSYPCDNQQYNPGTGALLYPNVVTEMVNGPTTLKANVPAGVKVWYFLECCNQAQHAHNDPGWASPWLFVGSRAPTSTEIKSAVSSADSIGADGIAWFPQSGGGTTTDATDPQLIPTMLDIANSHNGGQTSGTPTSGGTVIINEYIDNTGTLGHTLIAAGKNTFDGMALYLDVTCTKITSTSLIFALIQNDTNTSNPQVWIDSKSPGVGFRVRCDSINTFDFAWLVLEPF